MSAAVAATIKELREQRAELAAKVAGLDECIAMLEQLGAKAPGPASAAARQAKALKGVAKHPRYAAPPAPSKEERLEQLRKRQAERSAAAAPVVEGSGRILWAKREGFIPWRQKLMAPVLAHPRGSAERQRAYMEIAQAVHTAPDGNGSGQMSIACLKLWAKDMEDNSEGAAVDATPAAASHHEASQEEASVPAADAGPRVRPVTLSQRDLKRERKRTGALLTVVADRPLTRAECVDGPRPCPFVSCKHHLYLDVTRDGSLKLNFPNLEPDQMTESCALDVVDKQGSVTLDEVGNLTNLTRERISQIEIAALERMRPAAEDEGLEDALEASLATHQPDPMERMPETITHALAGITHAKLAEGERSPPPPRIFDRGGYLIVQTGANSFRIERKHAGGTELVGGAVSIEFAERVVASLQHGGPSMSPAQETP